MHSIDEIEPRFASTGLPGLGLAIIENGEVSTTASFGVINTATHEPVTDETIFHTCSISKPVSAFLVLTLVCRDQLDLDKPLSGYIDLPPRFESITPRHVLCHSGGLPNWFPDLTKRLQIDRVVRDGFHPIAEPGERFLYSGEGYFWLQRVVEKLTGRNFDALAKAELFGPLGMTSASYIWRSDFDTKCAWGHDLEDQPTDRSGPKRIHAWPNAAASLYATPTDIARFMTRLMDPEAEPSQVVETMLAPQVELDNGIAWSLGWGVEASNDASGAWYWHHGRGQFTNFAMWSPAKRSGLVTMTNTWRADTAERLSREIVHLFLPGEHPAFDWMPTRTMQQNGYLVS